MDAAFDRIPLKQLPQPRGIRLLVLALFGALMGWPLGTGAAHTLVPDGDLPLGVSGHIAVAIGGACAAMWYGFSGRWQNEKPWVAWVFEPMLYGLFAAVVAGIFWVLPWGPLFSFMTVPIALVAAVMPVSPIFVPVILFAPVCAWVCRLVLPAR